MYYVLNGLPRKSSSVWMFSLIVQKETLTGTRFISNWSIFFILLICYSTVKTNRRQIFIAHSSVKAHCSITHLFKVETEFNDGHCAMIQNPLF